MPTYRVVITYAFSTAVDADTEEEARSGACDIASEVIGQSELEDYIDRIRVEVAS